ncbi:cytidine deaminase [Streptomyces aureoverticillatus]|nr:cytidine deaminase [Streptomyces aureoverticillatus]
MTITPRALTAADQELIDLARAVVDANTDGEDGIHTVGAAVRAADGTTHVGINVYHFTGGPCAELVALGNARASGARRLTTIVAVGNMGRGVVGPCGRDRQVLFDHHPEIRVLLPTEHGIGSVPIKDLVPFATAWSPEGGSIAYGDDPSAGRP